MNTTQTQKTKELKTEIKKYFFAKKYGMKPANAIRKAEHIKELAKDYDGQDNWINKFKNGETIIGAYKKKLYFKFG